MELSAWERGRKSGNPGEIAKVLVALTLQLACREGSVGHSEANTSGREPEQRCRDLGAGCYCAEALDFAGPVPASTFFGPPDSRSKECTQVPPPPWRPVFLRLGGEGVVPGGRPGPPPVPAGATLRHVLRETGSGGADHVTNHLLTDGSGGTLDLTHKTICFRAYIHYSEDHPPPGNLKIARLGDASRGMAWQSGWGGHLESSRSGSGYDHPPQIAFTADFDADGSIDVDCPLHVDSTAGDLLVFRDCQSHWCRYEICADHSASTPPAVRGRWLQIGGPGDALVGPATGPWCTYDVPTVEGIAVFGQMMLMDLHGEQVARSTSDGFRHLSHGIVTVTPFDPSFWPGPAREFEGCDGFGGDRDDDSICDDRDPSLP